MRISHNAKKLLKERYCHPREVPQDVYHRVSDALSLGDTKFEKKLTQSMLNGIFLPNSPCLRNAGIKKGVLHACFVLDVKDTMESISDTLKDMIIIFKNGGGVGINFSKLRPKDSALSTGGTSSGVVSFMKLFDTATEVVKQGGFRRGALMGVLNFEHAEIMEFIRSKLTNQLTNFNISVMVSDKFMEQVEKGEDIELKDPRDDSTLSKINAKTIFDVICFCAWNSGDPGFLFYDRINKDNPLFPKQKIKCSNPCQPRDALLLDGDKLKIISEKGTTWKSWKTGTREILELQCNNGLKLHFTPEHKIMLDNNKFIKARDSLNENLKWGLGERVSKNIIEEEVLRGFLFGDGYICGGKLGIAVKLNKHKEKEAASLLIRNGFHIQKSGSFYISRKSLPFNASMLEKRVYNRDLPEEILYNNSNIVRSFLRGLFEANGSTSIFGQISLKGTCKLMIEKVQILLASFGIPSWFITNKSTKVTWNNGIYTSRENYNLQIAPRNAWLFKEKIGFISDRKNKRIKFSIYPYLQKLKVTSIKSLGKMEVWDYKMNKLPSYNFCQGIIASNCGETPLLPYQACCLGSINLSQLIKYNKFDFKEYEKQLEIACRALRNMNAISHYPLPEITKIMKETDPIGVGIMGFADALIKLGIYYDSEESLKFIDEIGEVYKATTEKVAKKCFYKRIIAPTGSLSILADCLEENTPIDTLEGKIPIKELEGKTPYLYSYDEINKKLLIQQAKKVWCKGQKEVYRVTFDTGDFLELTSNHKFLMIDNTYKETKDLSIGDSINAFYKYINSDNRYVIKSSHLNFEIQTWVSYRSNFGKIKSGCGNLIKIKRFHYNHGIPEYLQGHGAYKKEVTMQNHKVIKVEKIGFRNVYDIDMGSPVANFVANGVFVHNCSSGIEPVFSASFDRHLTYGVVSETRPEYKSKFLRTAHEIPPEWHLKVQAQWQKWLDGSVSKTVNLPAEASVDTVKQVYINAWKMGCKGITVFRDTCKTGVLKVRKQCEGDSCHL